MSGREVVWLSVPSPSGHIGVTDRDGSSVWVADDSQTLMELVGTGRLRRAELTPGLLREGALIDRGNGRLLLPLNGDADGDEEGALVALDIAPSPTEAPDWAQTSSELLGLWIARAVLAAARMRKALHIVHNEATESRHVLAALGEVDGNDSWMLSTQPRPGSTLWANAFPESNLIGFEADEDSLYSVVTLIESALVEWPGGPHDVQVSWAEPDLTDGDALERDADRLGQAGHGDGDGEAGSIVGSGTPARLRFSGSDGSMQVLGVLSGPLTYALAHNRVPLIRELQVRNTGARSLGEVTVEIEVESEIDPSPVDPITSSLGVVAAGELASYTFPLAPRAAALVTVDERVTAELVIRVVSSAGPRLTIRHPMDVLAYNQWARTATTLPSLAAFVMPAHPEVRLILSDASDLLLAQTGSPALQGYQAGEQRVHLIARAIYEVLAKREIRYSNPPASFEEAQKVRTADQVLEDRFGTCLDTTVLYAACLEEAGLRPVLIVLRGHALPGYLTHETHLVQPVIEDVNTATNLVDAGVVVPVESTSVTIGSNHLSFDAARREGAARMRRGGFDALIDVAQNRRSVKPLPSRRRQSDRAHATVEPVQDDVHEIWPSTGPKEASPLGQQAIPVATSGRMLADDSPARVRRWKTALLDLSLRNPLLHFKPSHGVRLHMPTDSLAGFEDIVASGYKVKLFPSDQLQDMHREAGLRTAQDLDVEQLQGYLFEQKTIFTTTNVDEYSTRFRGLRRKARTLEEETGANHLFLTFGELLWTDPKSNRDARSPLLLLPMRLDGGTKAKPGFTMHVEEGAYAVPNYSLLEKLRETFGIEVPELQVPLTDDAGVDINAVFRAVRRAIIDAEQPFVVDESCHLALLAFTNFRLWKDLEDHHETFLANPVVRHLAITAADPFVDPAGQGDLPIRESELLTPVPADGSQMEAMTWALAGRSFVLEGPPGTGKSQTITNLIANLLDQRKSVLFVAEKAAALEVVQRRLDAIGVGGLCLNLHGRDQRPALVRAQIKAAIDERVEANEQLWRATQSRLEAARARLERYAPALHTSGEAGLSAYEAHQQRLALGDGPVAPIPTSFVRQNASSAPQVRESLRGLGPLLDVVPDPANHPWRLSSALSEELPTNEELLECLEAVAAAVQRLDAERGLLAELSAAAIDLDHLERLFDCTERMQNAPLPSGLQIEELKRYGWEREVLRLEAEITAYRNGNTPAVALFKPDVLKLDVAALDLATQEASGRLFGKRRRLEAMAERLRPYLRAGSELRAESLSGVMTQLVAEAEHVRKLDAAGHALKALRLDSDWTAASENSVTEFRAAFEAARAADDLMQQDPRVEAALIDAGEREAYLAASSIRALGAFVQACRRFLEVIASTPQATQAWRGQLPLVAAVREAMSTWLQDGREQRFLALRRWAALSSRLAPLRRVGLDDYVAALLDRSIDSFDAETAFARGLAVAAFQERMGTNGLDAFDAVQHDHAAAQYVTEAESIRAQLPTVLPARLAAGRAPVSRLLVREVGRSRSRLSVRQLLDDHGSDVQQVTPCFLMSPDSVARFLAPDGMRFDVVIFDEASQVRVAEAVGALGRGTSCVIVGDSRQMPPTSFGAVTSDSDQEVERVESLSVPEDEESILTECIAADLPRRWLSWHYRSQHESLIAFSNQHYYDGRLASFPSPVSHDPGTGVHLREVNGEFERGKARVNREEAQAIVEEIRTRLTSPETVDQSIGVVTFNIQQRDLIASMLEQLDDPAVAAALEKEPAERLFVKNLENVQGDERDVILFSLAFSKDPSTGRLPLQFGPLINNGGERRLNVAVTRARRLVILFTSFKPADIDPKRSSSVGLAHLRAYMEMAAAQQHTADDVSPTSSTRDLHREDVAEALRARGLRVQTEVGLSDFKVDLAVGLPGEGPWRMAVLLDGPPWARRQTVADRDGFPLSVLKGPMGWPDVSRVWLPAWLSEREAVLDRLERAVREAEPVAFHVDASIQRADEPTVAADQQHDEETLVVGTRSSTAVDESVDGTDDATLLGHSYSDQTELGFDYAYEQFYLEYANVEETEPEERTLGSAPESVLGSRSVLDGLSGRANRKVVLEAIEQALAMEGPMELGRLARNIGRRFDLNRMGDERIRAVLRLIPKERVTSDHLGTFVWPSELSPELWTGYHRQSSYLERQLPEISPQEIANVMRAHDPYFAEDDTAGLFRAVMEVFGYTRLTNAVSTRLEAVHLWRANR